MIKLYGKLGSRVYDIEDTFFQYPGGEWDMKFQPKHFLGTQIAVVSGTVDANDLVKLRTWARVVRNDGGRPFAVIPYLPAARADRGVTTGAEIYADMINSAGLPVLAADVHSQLAANFYDDLIEFDMTKVAPYFNQDHYAGVIAPDKGAVTRAQTIADALDVPLFEAGKTRDFETGKLTGFEAPEGLEDYNAYLIVDDICDGGGTFIGLKEELKEQYIALRLHLAVTHGIFSQGTDTLVDHFSRIYYGDAVQIPKDHYRMTRIPLIKMMLDSIQDSN